MTKTNEMNFLKSIEEYVNLHKLFSLLYSEGKDTITLFGEYHDPDDFQYLILNKHENQREENTIIKTRYDIFLLGAINYSYHVSIFVNSFGYIVSVLSDLYPNHIDDDTLEYLDRYLDSKYQKQDALRVLSNHPMYSRYEYIASGIKNMLDKNGVKWSDDKTSLSFSINNEEISILVTPVIIYREFQGFEVFILNKTKLHSVTFAYTDKIDGKGTIIAGKASKYRKNDFLSFFDQMSTSVVVSTNLSYVFEFFKNNVAVRV